MAYTFILLAAFCVIVQVECQNYCPVCTNHTMCLYSGSSSKCNQIIKSGVTDADKTVILDEHNKYRQKVATGGETRGNPGPQPPASNMKLLSWDDENAKIAQMWAQQCTFEHDTCRNTNGTYVGQNMYMSWTTSNTSKANWTAAIKSFYEEVPRFNRSHINPFVFTPAAGHYTAVVWARTSKIGCGYINYKGTDAWYQHFYVCNYSPGGNVIGTEMYKVGAACSSCPGNCNTRYNGLCNI